MMKEVVIIKDGYEKVVEVLKENIATLEEAKNHEIAEAIAPIEAKYAQRLEDYKADLDRFIKVEMVEEPEHVEEVNEEPELAEVEEEQIEG